MRPHRDAAPPAQAGAKPQTTRRPQPRRDFSQRWLSGL